MGVIQVQGPVSGFYYNVNISGDTPTATEQARIDQYVAQQEAPYQQAFDSYFGQQEEVPIDESQFVEEVDRTAFGRGFAQRDPSRERSEGKTAEVLGEYFGLDWLKNRGTERREQAEERLRKLEAEDPSVGFDDIEGVGTALSFAGEQLGGEAEDIAIQTGATATGAVVGSAFGPIGTGLGATIGRGVGVGYTTIRSLPEMFSEAVEKQEEAGMDVSVGKAAAATAANALSEFLVDYFIVGKFLTPTDGKIAKRVLLEGGKSGGLEGLQEVQQAAVNRFQAGMDLFDEDAQREYTEAFVAGAVVGGPLGGAAGAIGRDPEAGKKKRDAEKELAEDIAEDYEFDGLRLKTALEEQQKTEGEQLLARAREDEVQFEQPQLALPKPELPDQPVALLPSPSSLQDLPETSPSDFQGKTFTKTIYDEVVRQVKADVTPSQEDVDAGLLQPKINVNKIVQKARETLPNINKKQITDVLAEMQSQGLIVENTDYTAKKTSKYSASEDLVAGANTPDVSLRRQIDSSAAKIKLLEEGPKKTGKGGLRRLQYELASARMNGTDLEGNETTEQDVLAEIANVEQQIATERSRIDEAQKRLQTVGSEMHVPRMERVGTPSTLRTVVAPEPTVQKLKERESLQLGVIKEEERQLKSVNTLINRLEQQAKKRSLSSIEQNRLGDLRRTRDVLSTKHGERKANFKSADDIVSQANSEAQEASDLDRSLEAKLAAAKAKQQTKN